MSTSAIIFSIISMGLLWGGLAICLAIAVKKQ